MENVSTLPFLYHEFVCIIFFKFKSKEKTFKSKCENMPFVNFLHEQPAEMINIQNEICRLIVVIQKKGAKVILLFDGRHLNAANHSHKVKCFVMGNEGQLLTTTYNIDTLPRLT